MIGRIKKKAKSSSPRKPGSALLVPAKRKKKVVGWREWVRLPDANIGYLAGNWLTMGMLLTTPMIFIGAGMMLYAYRRNAPSGNLGAVKA